LKEFCFVERRDCPVEQVRLSSVHLQPGKTSKDDNYLRVWQKQDEGIEAAMDRS